MSCKNKAKAIELFDVEVYKCLCECQKFTVKGINADSSDFGDIDDLDPDNAEDYCCGNMHFTPKLATDEVLKKYGITADEYNQIASVLEDKLSFGACGWCS